MKIMDAAMKMSKFRGSFLGVLLGDCCGGPYEGDDPIAAAGERLVLRKCLDKLEGPYFTAPQKPYSDDTVMSKCVARTLLKCRGIDARDLAKEFVQEYFREPRRGYGPAVIGVFARLQKEKFEDPLGPARDQFQGSGSYGNGGAMRVAPVALFCHNKTNDELIDLAIQSARVTHTHPDGLNGAILQALAIHAAFQCNPNDAINVGEFLQNLDNQMAKIENVSKENLDTNTITPYGKQLKEVSRLLSLKMEPSDERVINVLGTSVSALYSVPTAIYCFLRSFNDIHGIATTNPFRRGMEYAITLGGDTDTIASMTCAIAGAYYGHSVIPENLIKHCEHYEECLELADQLYAASQLEMDAKNPIVL